MHRIAVYSDVHGNVAALEAVTADMDAHDVSERYCLGDLVGLGPRPSEVVSLVRACGDHVVQGNYDRAIGLHLCSPGSDFPTPLELLDGAESYAFTIAETRRWAADYLYLLPRDLRLEVDGARFVFCHGTPRLVSGVVGPDAAPAHLLAIARDADADVVCCGHSHVPFRRSVITESGVVHWVNVGSVGRSRDGDSRAAWVELAIGTQAEVVEHAPTDTACRRIGTSEVWLGVLTHRVAYDVDAVVRDMVQRGLPMSLAAGLRSGLEEHEVVSRSPRFHSLAEAEDESEPELACGHSRRDCTCMFEDRTAAYECLARLFRGDIAEVSASVRRLRISMRGCRVNRHVDEAAILAAFEGADFALRTSAGRAAFEEERDRLYGLRAGFDPFVNLLSPDEITYLSGDVQENLATLETLYRDGAFTVPEIRAGMRAPGHISTELSFMAHCLRGVWAGESRSLDRARDFFIQHLAEWGILFAVVIGQHACEPVMRYAGLALDKHLLCEGMYFHKGYSEMFAAPGERS